MIIPIKIYCGCGQHYSFEVEPVGGRMPHSVGCPVCGADGTVAADQLIAQNLAPQPVAVSAPEPAAEPVRVGALTVAPPPTMRLAPTAPLRSSKVFAAPKADLEKAETEARSKIFWGDPPAEAVSCAMMHGMPRDEAVALVDSLVQERVAALREIGIRKTFVGIGLICVPLIAWAVFVSIGVIPLKLFALAVMVGLYGAYLIFKGTFMIFLPKSEGGDVADK